jgi:hypothetical protein
MAAWSDKLVCERQRAAETARGPVLPYIREALYYSMPWRLPGNLGLAAMQRLFDGTAPNAAQRAANKLQQEIVPPGQRWGELEAGPLVPANMIEKVNRQLATPNDVILSALNAVDSAFNSKTTEVFTDFLLGTGAMLALEGDDRVPIRWQTAAAWALAIEEGATGRIDNVFWRKKYPAWLLPQHWPQAAWSGATQKLIASGSTDKVEITQATYFDPDIVGWRLCIMENDRCVYDVARDRTNPWIIPRYWTSPDDPWGRGPLMLGLPDVRTANKTVEMILRAAAFQLAPPLMVLHDGVVNPDTLRLAPQALIRVARTGGPMGASITPLDVGANVNLGQIILQDQRQNITKTIGDTQLPPEAGAVRSATEWVQRTKDLQYDNGAAFGRLTFEFVPQVYARTIDILDRKKVSTLVFDQLKIDQLVMRVKLTGPLARAQNLNDVETIVQFWELARSIGGEAAFYQVAALQDGLPRLAKLMGVPMWAVNDEATRQMLAKAAGTMAAQVMQQNGGAPQGGAPNPYAPAAPPSSPSLSLVA